MFPTRQQGLCVATIWHGNLSRWCACVQSKAHILLPFTVETSQAWPESPHPNPNLVVSRSVDKLGWVMGIFASHHALHPRPHDKDKDKDKECSLFTFKTLWFMIFFPLPPVFQAGTRFRKVDKTLIMNSWLEAFLVQWNSQHHTKKIKTD